MKIKPKPIICIGRYTQHTHVWTDEQGVKRCRRCHVPWEPAPVKTNTTTNADRRQEYLARAAQHRATFIDKKIAPHNPACPHPAPSTDIMAIHKDAQQRMYAGEKQVQCPVCNDWVWETQIQEEITP